MFVKKMLVICVPLAVCVLLSFVFPLLSGLAFYGSFLRGLLIGLGLGALLPLLYRTAKQSTAIKLLWTPVVLLFVLLLYQYLTVYGMLHVPVLSFLNVRSGSSVEIESAMLGFLVVILFMNRK